MQTKIIALAIAAAMAAPAAAMAAPTVYGQVNMAYEVVDTGSAVAGAGETAASRNKVSSNVSRLGIKGSEDLGSGLTGVFQMEGEVKVDDAAAAPFAFNRNTFLGVAGGFGTVVLGQHDTMYKMATRDMDVFKDSIADNRSLMGLAGINLDIRASDVLAYVSPDFSGFNFAVAMVGEGDNSLDTKVHPAVDGVVVGLGAGTITPATPKTASATTLSAQYGMKNWKAVFGYIAANMENVPGATVVDKYDVTGTKVGGTFGMNMFSVNAVYEMTQLKATGGKVEQDNVYVSGTVNVGSAGKVKLAYTMAGELKLDGTALKNTGASQVSVGYDHALTKNTTLFALYSMIGNDKGATYGFTSSGSTGDLTAADLA
ncbi:MAG TPA: porin, partial [Gallionella sp.]